MIIEPTATTTEQIAGQSSSTATMAARPLFPFTIRASPPHPFGNLRLAPSSGGLTLSTRSARRLQDHRIKVKNRKHADFASGLRRHIISVGSASTPCRYLFLVPGTCWFAPNIALTRQSHRQSGQDPGKIGPDLFATLGEEFTGVDALEADSHACIAISTTTNDSDRTPASPRRTPPLDHCGQVSPCR